MSEQRPRGNLGWQIVSILIVCVLVFCAAAKVVVRNEGAFSRWIDEQTRGVQVMRQGVGTLVTAARDPQGKVKSAIVVNAYPGTLAAAVELTQGYLAASPFLFRSDTSPMPSNIVVTSASIQPEGKVLVIATAAGERCRLELLPARKTDFVGAGWTIEDAHCTP
ncbi:hypothetical protein [Paraburkholderia humisilvae]|uniref:Uncharacterized protein n=1 Tax=Paraburkholderia humisilvae TaxID=627669 RepID=A0A6J5DM79_9BURK|nr:hypothetical protein [Paraburkholderia humisilvae]CAB3754617.1 hypothetical protein LMG29542_02400 [Paraburkholderia humisilvae]